MWWMMILCALPVVILFLADGKLSSAGYLWPILIIGFIGAHFWIMFRGHCSHDHENVSANKDIASGQTDAVHDAHDEHKGNKSEQHGGRCH